MSEPTDEEIARRAYQIFQRRGGVPNDGRSVDDWEQARRELEQEARDFLEDDDDHLNHNPID